MRLRPWYISVPSLTVHRSSLEPPFPTSTGKYPPTLQKRLMEAPVGDILHIIGVDAQMLKAIQNKNDYDYSQSQDYLKELQRLEEIMWVVKSSPDKLSSVQEEYKQLIARYGARTDDSRALLAALDKERGNGALYVHGEPTNLDNGTEQAEAEETPWTEGESDVAKRKTQRVNINGEIKWVTGSTKQEIIEEAARLMIANGMLTPSPAQAKPQDTPTFKQYAQKWYELYKKPSVQPATLNAYNAQMNNHIIPYFGEMRIDEINTDDLQRFFVSKADMSASYTRQMRGLLREIFEAAMEDRLRTDNPEHSKRITMPKNAVERQPMELDEAQEVLRNVASLPTQPRLMLALLLYTGIRRGEMLGLRWDDISFDRKIIQIKRQVVYGNGNQPQLKPPKSKAGIRGIPLLPELESILAPYRASGFILHAEDDAEKPLTLQMYRKAWKQTAAIDLHKATPHCLRHTFITMSVDRTDIKTLQEVAGHSDCNITLNRYAHARKDKIEKAVKDFAGMYGNVTDNVDDTNAVHTA